MNPFRKIFDPTLGPDFWKFRLGQLVSILGNGCRSVALSWWILEKTGSAKAIASVLVPAMIVNLTLLPLFGPLGDNFSRKRLIVIADLGRCAVACCICAMVLSGYFNLPLLAGLYIASSLGTALFNAAEGGIVPQIVRKKKLQSALQQSYAISSFGGVAGGIAGGLIVSTFGVLAAFLTDAVSFLVGGLSSNLIKADTRPKRGRRVSPLKSFSTWRDEFLGGLRTLWKIRVLFWVCIQAMMLNFTQAPFWVALPVFVKLGRNMPAWFLGSLEGSIALGAILGSLSLQWTKKFLPRKELLMVCLALQGAGFFFLPFSPGVLLPLVMMVGVGVGSSTANLLFDTQLALVVPDSYRSRFSSIIDFLCLGLYPLGMSLGSLLIAQVGLTPTLELMGVAGILLAPPIFFVPNFVEFLQVPVHKAKGFLKKYYPDVAL